MPIRNQIKLGMFAAMLVSSAAFAQQQTDNSLPEIANTSGPAAGSVVLPSTVIQKLQENLQQGRSVEVELRTSPGAAGGLPGVEGLPGTESGRIPSNAPDDTAE